MKVPGDLRAAMIRRSTKTLIRSLAFGLAAAAATAGSAQVTGVITRSDVTVQMQPGATPGDTGLFRFIGSQIRGSVGSNAFGSGAAFASTARVDPDGIDFQNGNASGGLYAFSTSRTAIDITFTNDDATAVAPMLRSSILPAGMGLFIDNPCLNNVANCGAGHLGNVTSFQRFHPGALPSPDNEIAGASFAFSVTSGATVLYSLSGSIILAYDPASRTNIMFTDFDAAQAALNGFRLTSLPGDPTQFGVVWDATHVEIGLTDGGLLQPGDSMSFSYEAAVQTFSRTPCFGANRAACIIGYSSFGDPIGRGGGIIPGGLLSAFGQPSADPAAAAGGIAFATFEFGHPVYRDGVVTFDMNAPVAEPATWAMLILGFGLVGAALRRRPSWVDRVA